MGRTGGYEGSMHASTAAWDVRTGADGGRLGQANSNEVGEGAGR